MLLRNKYDEIIESTWYNFLNKVLDIKSWL